MNQARVGAGCASCQIIHEPPAGRSIVLLHGLAACPQQFSDLGQRLFERGYNVLIPLMPFHGNPDPLTHDLNHLTADGLRAYALEAVETARQFGGRVSVLGFSTGGVLAAWLAMEVEWIDRVVLVAPVFGLSFLPPFSHPLVLWLIRHLPNTYVWWDPIRRDKSPYLSSFGYPGFPLRALVEVMDLGLGVYRQASRRQLLAQRAVFVLNELEPAVNNRMARHVAAAWQSSGRVQVHWLSRRLQLQHDFFAPNRKNSGVACDQLVDWIDHP